MRATAKRVSHRVYTIHSLAKLPDGYMWTLSSENPGDGKRFSAAVVRKDFQGGFFIGLRAYNTRDAMIYFDGVIAGLRLLEQIEHLPKIKEG